MRMLTLVLVVLALSAFIGCQSNPMDGSDVQSAKEGIKVRGDWTVEVSNPDGSLVRRQQFTNAFMGKYVVAALLSFDVVLERFMTFSIQDSPSVSSYSGQVRCIDALVDLTLTTVPAKTTHASNDAGNMYNSAWNGSCTLKIDANEPMFFKSVYTGATSAPSFPNTYQGTPLPNHNLSSGPLDEPIEVWDGQVIAATVILSVE